MNQVVSFTNPQCRAVIRIEDYYLKGLTQKSTDAAF